MGPTINAESALLLVRHVNSAEGQPTDSISIDSHSIETLMPSANDALRILAWQAAGIRQMPQIQVRIK